MHLADQHICLLACWQAAGGAWSTRGMVHTRSSSTASGTAVAFGTSHGHHLAYHMDTISMTSQACTPANKAMADSNTTGGEALHRHNLTQPRLCVHVHAIRQWLII